MHDDSNQPNIIDRKKFIAGPDSKLKKAINLVGRKFAQNSTRDNNVAVAVIGCPVTVDNLVYVECGKDKTCGFGYGPIAAAVKMNYIHMLPFNQQDAKTD